MQIQANTLFEDSSDTPEQEKAAVDKFRQLFEQRDNSQAKSPEDGYIRFIAYESLLEKASEFDLLILMNCRAGDYVMRGTALFEYQNSTAVEFDLATIVDECIAISDSRTQPQDLEYSIRQLVEIALRALSPGINDPFTAMTCIDRLGSLICLMAGKRMPSELMVDEKQTVRLAVSRSTFEGLVEAAFNQIRQNSHTHVDVTIRLLETLCEIIKLVPEQEHCKPLERQANMIMQKLQREAFTPGDYEAIENRFKDTQQALQIRERQG